MTSLEHFVLKIKPALDTFLRNPTRENLSGVEKELSKFSWSQLQIFHVQILLPLVLKLEKLNGHNEDLQTGTLNCIRLVISKLYIKEVQGLKTMLVIVLKQIRDCEKAEVKQNLSEEIKLAVVECIMELFQRSTTDVLEEYYTQESALFLGQVLLTLVEFIEKEKYKKIVVASIHCLMTIFYVHETADVMDVVLRSQVADALFIFLPKIVTVLCKTCLADEKLGETLISTSMRALARILTLIFEETNVDIIRTTIDIDDFKMLVSEMQAKSTNEVPADSDILGSKTAKEHIEDRLKQMQTNGRSKLWFGATSRKLKIIFRQLGSLGSHRSAQMRYEYAQMCCSLLQKCANNMRENFIFLLENAVAMSEDEEDERIRVLCQQTLSSLQCCSKQESLFDESAELLFDEHLAKLPRIISRCDESEQRAEFLFFKGFLRNLSANKLQMLLSLPRNLEMFCMCLVAAAHLNISRDLLTEEYALRLVGEQDFEECSKLHWRTFKNLSPHCVEALKEICCILGRTAGLNRIIFDFFMDMLTQKQSEVMNEIILILVWLAAENNNCEMQSRKSLVELLLNEILSENHWHLALQPDQMRQLKVDKPTDWMVDRTLGLYESAIEIRIQDYDSDDDSDVYEKRQNVVTIADAQFNVLHTCIILDAVGHCAKALGELFENYLFRCLHRVLLKVGSNNTIVYQSGNFALISMQRALKFSKTTHFIESYTDYITFHMNRILKKNPESKSAVDILTIVLQFSSRNALPHLDSIFQTIREECSKSYQSENVISYLKVFIAFLTNVSQWQKNFENEINDIVMQIDAPTPETNLLEKWLDTLQRPSSPEERLADENVNTTCDEKMEIDPKEETETTKNPISAMAKTSTLPQHIQIVKDILEQVAKFVSSAVQAHQILSLECLICGLALLRDYEDEMLPLVHRIWQPLMERFRQKDAIVLNRCFTLLALLALHAKEFIAKRSLNDVIPFLIQFLTEAAARSEIDTSLTQTQQLKLQIKLLQHFASLIQNMQIDGKHLNEISEVISLYLSQKQPKDLQKLAENYFKYMRLYNGPLVYLVVLKKLHLKDYKENTDKVLKEFGIK